LAVAGGTSHRQIFDPRTLPLEAQRRRDFVIGEFQLLGGEWQRLIEAGENVDATRVALADQRLGNL
jgi:hypothetical protein